jgi:hypothetical protein
MLIQTKGQTVTFQTGPSFSKLFDRINYLDSDDDDRLNLDNILTGFNATAGIEYWDHKYYNLSSNAGFIQKGGKDTAFYWSQYGIQDSIAPYRFRFNYLTFNTGFVFKVPLKQSITPYLFAGPRIDYLVSYREINNWGEIKMWDSLNDLNHVIFGLITGVGIKYNFSKVHLGIVFNYYINLNKIWYYEQVAPVEWNYTRLDRTFSLTDRTFTLNFQIGYKF